MTVDARSMLPEAARGTDHFGIAYGLGVDSTAILVELVRRRLRPDFILFADVGSEKESTHRFLPVIQEFLAAAGFPPVTVVRYEPVRSPYTSIEGNMTMNATLPGAVFNRGSCTAKWKIAPQQKWVKQHRHLYPGRIVKAIGFDAGEGYRRLRANDRVHAAANDRYVYWYPLQDWGWDRNACKAAIRGAGLPVPPKSACFFCANMKPAEVMDLTEDERGRIVRMEMRAEPYNRKVEGLWRRGRRRDRRPGSITEYMLRNGIPFTAPDDLPPMPLNPSCAKAVQGFTFRPPHRRVSLAEMVAARRRCEDAGHRQIVQGLLAL